MFRNWQPTLLLWHYIKAHFPTSIGLNDTILYENYLQFNGDGAQDPPSIIFVLDTIILCIHILNNQMKSTMQPLYLKLIFLP